MTGGQKRTNASRVLKCMVALLATIPGFVALTPGRVVLRAPPPCLVAPARAPSLGAHERGGGQTANRDNGPVPLRTLSVKAARPPTDGSSRRFLYRRGRRISPTASWAYLLAGYLGWRAVVRGVPGAGYVRAGKDGMGPVGRLLAEADLSRARPSLVVIQAGHDDIGEPSSLIAKRETADLQLVRKYAPDARIAIISVFLRQRHRAFPTRHPNQ